MSRFLQDMLAGLGSGQALGTSIACFDLTALMYLLSSVGYVTYLAWRSRPVWTVAYALAIAGLGAQTAALILRWIAAGWDHPPFTNLYESLVFFGWGIVLVYVIVEALYRVRIAGALVIPIAFLAMGMASLSPNRGIEPLVPALQDIWLHLHVFSASIGYAAFLIAFVFSVLYLVKDGLPVRYFATTAGFFTIFSAIAITRGDIALLRFTLTKVTYVGGRMVEVGVPGRDFAARAVIEGAGTILFLACVLFALCAVLFTISSREGREAVAARRVFSLFFAATFLMTIFLFHVFLQTHLRPDVSPRADVYGLALLVASWFLSVIVLIFHARREGIRKLLPDTRTLDRLSYRAVMVAFPIMTFVIVSGAVWANKAWGRYWGWDPKETASLVTWGIYLLYLHARLTAGWSGRRAALISIIGFVSVVFTYLGVNLVISGLHSYATG